MYRFRNESVDRLFQTMLNLETIEECYEYFADICTIKELQSIAQRVVVAKMLKEGRVYSEIVDKTGASTATISRVNRSLSYGNDGYDMVFKRMNE